MRTHQLFQLKVAAVLLALRTLAHAAPGDVDLSFDPGSGVNGDVRAIVVQSDGKVLIGGDFTTVKGAFRNRIARLNRDGSVDASFNPGRGADASISSMVFQTDGKVLIGGSFATFDGMARSRIARLNRDGSLDNTFAANITGGFSICVAAQSDGKPLIGGDFDAVDGTARNCIARLNADGSLDAGFDPGTGANAPVLSLAAQSDGKVVIGGWFTSLNGRTLRRIARLNANGSVDEDFNPGTGVNNGSHLAPNGVVYSVQAQSDGKILVGGDFTSVNGMARGCIARLNPDGSVDTSFVAGTSSSAPGDDPSVRIVSVQADGHVLIAGGFDLVNGTSRSRVARLTSNGGLDTGFNVGTIAGIGYPYIFSVAGEPDGNVLIGGNFSLIAGYGRHGIARLNSTGNLDTTFNSEGVDGGVGCIAVQPDGKLLIGGGFISVNGIGQKRIARLNADGGFDTSFNAGTGAANTVETMALQADGKVLLGGGFSSFNGQIRNRTVRLNANGSIDTTWSTGTGANASVRSVVLQPDGKAVIGGSFTFFNGTSRNRIARLNTNGSLDTSFDPGAGADGVIWAVALQPDGKALVGGLFTSIDGFARNRIARLNANGSVDTAFNPGMGVTEGSIYAPGGWVYSVTALADGKILIAGDFTSVSGTARSCIARLNSDGSLDASFVVGTSSSFNGDPAVRRVAVDANGKILIAGAFEFVNGISRARIARLNADGSLDASFSPSTGADNVVGAVAVQSDGKVLVGGGFSSVNGVLRPYVARLHADYLPSRVEISLAGNLPALQITGEVGQPYILEYVSALPAASSDWTVLSTFTLANSPQTVIDDTAIHSPKRFYRARMP